MKSDYPHRHCLCNFSFKLIKRKTTFCLLVSSFLLYIQIKMTSVVDTLYLKMEENFICVKCGDICYWYVPVFAFLDTNIKKSAHFYDCYYLTHQFFFCSSLMPSYTYSENVILR